MPRAWDYFIVAATAVSLAVVLLELGFERGTVQRHHLSIADGILCAVFFADFVARARQTPHFGTFLRRNWIDLVAAVPVIDAFRAGRIVRVLRVLRLLKVDFVGGRMGNYGIRISSEVMSGLGLVAVTVWLTTAVAFYAFERGSNEGVSGFGDALWWSMTTLSTVGYGDLYPSSLGGRVVAVITMVIGVGVLGTLAATMATVLIDVRERGRRGLRSYRMKGHLLVLGWSSKAETALQEFRHDPRFTHTPVVIVADLEKTPTDVPGVGFVRGVPMQQQALEKASAAEAAAAIVFSADTNEPRSDHETALTVLSFRRLNADAHVSAELVSADNQEHLTTAGCQVTVEGNALTSALLVASVQDRGVSDLVQYLISSERGSELHRIPVPDEYIGGPYRAFAVDMAALSRPVLALARGTEMLVNPEPETTLGAGDEAFIAARPQA